MTRLALCAGLLLSALIAACAPAPTANVSTPAATLDTANERAGSSPLEDALRAGSARPLWETMTLTNAATGATFTLADYSGKTIYVEPIATSCAGCREKQTAVRAAREQLGEASYAFISLSVEPSDTTEMLAEYAARENFPWIFAAAPPDMVRELVAQFGRTISDTAATPHFIISPQGAISQLSTGVRTAEQLMAELTAAAGA